MLHTLVYEVMKTIFQTFTFTCEHEFWKENVRYGSVHVLNFASDKISESDYGATMQCRRKITSFKSFCQWLAMEALSPIHIQ